MRNNIEKLTPLGIEAETYIRKGSLVPDDSMVKCILEEIKDIKGSFLLDGFPCTKTQAEKLWEVQKIESVINLVVPYELIVGEYPKIYFLYRHFEIFYFFKNIEFAKNFKTI